MRGEEVDSAAQERHVMGDHVAHEQDRIKQEWLDRLQDEVLESEEQVAELRPAMGDYLRLLAGALRDGPAVEKTGTAAWLEVAREHALTRVRQGFDIAKMVHEFILLRRTLFEEAERNGLLGSRVASDLADLIEAAISTAVKSYVDARDWAAKQQEAAHIGFVTHELRNPLATAMLAASQARRGCSTDEQTARALNLLDRSHRTLQLLIERVLANERFEAGGMEVHPVETTLKSIIEAALIPVRDTATSKGISLRTKFDPDVRLRIDPILTISALQNLAENAVKFTDAGEVLLEVVDRSGEIEVHVYDNCAGLPEEELRTIFEPFRRGAHRGKAGTGLGLAIARRAVEAQGGTIHAEVLREARGCHFWFTLPRWMN